MMPTFKCDVLDKIESRAGPTRHHYFIFAHRYGNTGLHCEKLAKKTRGLNSVIYKC